MSIIWSAFILHVHLLTSCNVHVNIEKALINTCKKENMIIVNIIR